MAAWVPWLLMAISGGVIYQLGMKLISSKLPLSIYCIVSGSVLALAGFILYKLNPEKVSLTLKDTSTLLIIALIGLSTVAIDSGYFNMYRNGAPVSISRTIVGAAITIVVLLAGTLFFKEDTTQQQYLGVFIVMLGLFLITYKF